MSPLFLFQENSRHIRTDFPFVCSPLGTKYSGSASTAMVACPVPLFCSSPTTVLHTARPSIAMATMASNPTDFAAVDCSPGVLDTTITGIQFTVVDAEKPPAFGKV